MRKELQHLAVGLTAVTLLATLGACQKTATGQVAAVVNGEEVSQQELNAELATVRAPASADKTALRAQALQRIIDRRVLAQQAKTDGLDRNPEYLLRKRQLDETLLIQLYAKKTQDTLRIPDAAAITRYIGDHPQVFANRAILNVDQIRFPAPQDPSVLNALKSAHTLNAVADALKARGIAFDRGAAKIDTAQVPPALLAQVRAVAAGEPFVVPTPQGVVVSVIIGSQNAPLPEAQAKPIAVQAMRNEELAKLMDQRLKAAKASAKIEYQPGFGPPPAGGAAKAPTKS